MWTRDTICNMAQFKVNLILFLKWQGTGMSTLTQISAYNGYIYLKI